MHLTILFLFFLFFGWGWSYRVPTLATPSSPPAAHSAASARWRTRYRSPGCEETAPRSTISNGEREEDEEGGDGTTNAICWCQTYCTVCCSTVILVPCKLCFSFMAPQLLFLRDYNVHSSCTTLLGVVSLNVCVKWTFNFASLERA